MSQIGGVGVAALHKVVIRLNRVICEACGQVQRRGRPNRGAHAYPDECSKRGGAQEAIYEVSV